MTSSSKVELIGRLHALYGELTGQPVRLDYAREQAWVLWLRYAGEEPEGALRLVVAHLQRGIREGTRNAGALKFRNLIGQADFFEEDLAEARARARVCKPDANRAGALRASGRPGDLKETKGVRTAAEVIGGEGFQAMVKLRESLE